MKSLLFYLADIDKGSKIQSWGLNKLGRKEVVDEAPLRARVSLTSISREFSKFYILFDIVIHIG